jgi:transposase
MRINYQMAISESVEELVAHERLVRSHKVAVRVRLLVLLKSGQVKTLGEAAPLVGYSPTQVLRWWTRYRTEGLEREAHYPGVPSRLTPEARADLHAAMQRGEIATLEQARQYLQQHWGIVYHSINGVWWQFQQERTKKKTGRRRHVCLFPRVTGDWLQLFLNSWHQETGGASVGVVLDNAPSHKKQAVQWPDGMTPLFLPPYSPELNPAEQVFRMLRHALSNRLFADEDDLEAAITLVMRHFWDHPEIVIRLTDYPWWRAAIDANLSLSP